MFGIVGQGICKEDVSIFRDLMIFNAVRGVDATGFVSGKAEKTSKVWKANHRVVKKVADPIYFLQTLEKNEEDALDNVFHDFKLGHTRWRTTGENSAAAAQPFLKDNVIGTHNGTVHFDYNGFNSDSDRLYSMISDIGIKATVLQMKEQDGYALVFFDKTTGMINILRNSKKDLWFTYHPTRQVLYYSTELGMLRAALDRRGIKYNECYYPETNWLYTINPQNLKDHGKPRFGAVTEVLPLKVNLPATTQGAPFDGGKTLEGPGCDC